MRNPRFFLLKLLLVLAFFAPGFSMASPFFELEKSEPLRAKNVETPALTTFGTSLSGFTRTDRYRLRGGGLNPWDILDLLQLPLGFRIDENSELVFVQTKATAREAKLAGPYGPAQLPLRAGIALSLKPGDYVSFRARLDLLLSPRLSVALLGMNPSAEKQFGLRGHFLIQASRLENNRIRLHFISSSGKSSAHLLGLGYELPLQIFGLNQELKNTVDNIGITPFRLLRESAGDQTISIEADFQLDDPRAAAAYDKLMRASLREKATPASLFQMHDFAEAERIYEADLSRPAGERRIDFRWEAKADTKSSEKGFTINLLAVKLKAGTVSSSSEITDPQNGKMQWFDLSGFRLNQRTLFGTAERNEAHSVGILRHNDEETLRFRSEWTGSHLETALVETGEVRKSRRQAERLAGANYFNGSLTRQLTFPPASFLILQKGDGSFESAFRDFLQDKDLSGLVPFYTPTASGDGSRGPCSTIDCFDPDLRSLGKLIRSALSPGLGREERAKRFSVLMEFSLFQRYGGDFLAGQLPAGKRNQLGFGIWLKKEEELVVEERDPLWNSAWQTTLDFIELNTLR